MAIAYTIFETAIGDCALAWRGEAICAASLPATTREALRAHLSRGAEMNEAPPPDFVARAIDLVVRLINGEAADLTAIPLDRSGIEPFANRVYDDILRLGPGETTTYGEIAARLGDKSFARAVGAALGANPIPIIIPCHRVLAANGAMGGFSAPGGASSKRRLLEIEGAFAVERLPLFGG